MKKVDKAVKKSSYEIKYFCIAFRYCPLKRDCQSLVLICASLSGWEAVGAAPLTGAAGSVSALGEVAQCSSTKNLKGF